MLSDYILPIALLKYIIFHLSLKTGNWLYHGRYLTPNPVDEFCNSSLCLNVIFNIIHLVCFELAETLNSPPCAICGKLKVQELHVLCIGSLGRVVSVVYWFVGFVHGKYEGPT